MPKGNVDLDQEVLQDAVGHLVQESCAPKQQRYKNEELFLQALKKCSNIDLSDVLQEMEKINKNNILNQHPYNVWQASDGRWKTYLPDGIKPDKRKMVARKTKEAIEEAIVTYYEEKSHLDEITIRRLYPLWLKSKSEHTRGESYIRRISAEWNKYYENSEIVDIPLEKMSKGRLDDWAHMQIKQNDFTKKQFYNMTVIIRQIFQYAMDHEYIAVNNFAKVHVNSKLFHKDKKKEDETQVFLLDEQKKIIDVAWRMYHRSPKCTSSLAIVLMFLTGCRVGEISALKFSDLEGNYIHIQRMEATSFELEEDGQVNFQGRKVVEYTKSEAGDRLVYLTEEARKIIEVVRLANEQYELCDDDFIFVAHDNRKKYNTIQRVRAGTLGSKLIRYCKMAGIPEKSTHKIRKTFISTLIDENVNINTIRKMVGHEDERTTYASYCFDRHQKNEIEDHLEEIFQKQSS